MIGRSTTTPDHADHDRRDHQHREPDVDAAAGRDDRRIAAEHQELAMREIDDAHHAEDDRQPDADQRQAGDRVEDLDRQESNEIHVHLSQARCGADAPSDLDHVLLVVVRILDEIADGGGIGRLLLREVFEHLELLVLDFGDVDVERRSDASAGRS